MTTSRSKSSTHSFLSQIQKVFIVKILSLYMAFLFNLHIHCRLSWQWQDYTITVHLLEKLGLSHELLLDCSRDTGELLYYAIQKASWFKHSKVYTQELDIFSLGKFSMLFSVILQLYQLQER